MTKWVQVLMITTMNEDELRKSTALPEKFQVSPSTIKEDLSAPESQKFDSFTAQILEDSKESSIKPKI